MFEGTLELLERTMSYKNHFVNITKTLADTAAFAFSYQYTYPAKTEKFNKIKMTS